MNKLLFLAALVLALASCKEDANRQVVLVETPLGHPFHFMPIYEDDVTDITITFAWPMSWAFTPDRNPAVPLIAAEAILSGGTDELARQDVLELFNDKNSSGQLYARADHAIGELIFPIEHIDDIVPVASELLASPQFDQAWIDRIKQGFLANQTQMQEQAAHKMWAVARLAILGETPINGFLSLPDLTAIDDVTVDDLRSWHAETIVKDQVTISVTGAISRADAGKAVDLLLAGLPEAQSQALSKATPNFEPRVVLLHLPDAEKTTLGFIGRLPPTSDGGDLMDTLILNHFGRSGSGPLFDAVRTDLRASYGFQAGFGNYDRATRIMFIGGEIETAKLAEAADLIRTTYESYRTAPELAGIDDLRRQIAEATTQNVLYVDVAARTILELVLDGRNPGDAPRLGEMVESITEQDVRERLATVYPSGEDLIVIAASPDASALPGACVITEIAQVLQCP